MSANRRQRAAEFDEGRGEGPGVDHRVLVEPPEIDGGSGPAADRRQGRAQPAQRRRWPCQLLHLRGQVLPGVVGDHPQRRTGQAGGRGHAGHGVRLHVHELGPSAVRQRPLRLAVAVPVDRGVASGEAAGPRDRRLRDLAGGYPALYELAEGVI